MNEQDIIRAIRHHARPCPGQRNGPFEADAEIVELSGALAAVTVDEFSAEDCLLDASRLAAGPGGASASAGDEGRRLGWNLVVATLSDLLAVGADAKFLLHSMVISPDMGREFLEGFSAGMQDALDEYGAFLLGGDAGVSGVWRYTGVGIGTFAGGGGAERPMSRVVGGGEGIIGLTGEAGGANAAAMGAIPHVRFQPRIEQARAIRSCGGACIDTSDGLAWSLAAIQHVNPAVRMEVDLERIPYDPRALAACRELGVPPEVLLLGSAGEYELLCFVPADCEERLAAAGVRGIGTFRRAGVGEGGGSVNYRLRRGRTVRQEALPDPRQIGDLGAYKAAVLETACALFG